MTDKWSGTICEILVECIMRNKSVNLIILNLAQWFRCCLNDFLSGALTIYANLKEGIMGNLHVKLYGIWTSGSKTLLI